MSCNASALHGVGPPVLSSEGFVAYFDASPTFDGYPMSLEQAIVPLGFACLTLAVCGQAPVVVFTPDLRLISSMHDL